MAKLREKIQGEAIKEDKGPLIEWWPHPFSGRDAETPPEMDQQMIWDRIDAHECPRCAKKVKEIKKSADGRVICGCGLCFTDHVLKNYGLTAKWLGSK